MKKQEEETPKEQNERRISNRLVYNNCGLYSFVQMLAYQCLRFGKELFIISERDITKMCYATVEENVLLCELRLSVGLR